MRPRLAFAAFPALVLVLLAGAALADQPGASASAGGSSAPPAAATAKPAAAPAKPAAAAPSVPKQVLKDPENKRGISPYMEAVVRGQRAFVARDIPGAVTAFQDAIKIDTEQALAFYRLGEAQLESGKPDEAEIAWNNALKKPGSEDQHAKVLFAIADLHERQKKWASAKEAWSAYAAYLQAHAKVIGYPAVSIERTKVIDRHVKDEIDYAAVKERIAKRQAEREAEAIENAKKDKLNR